MSSFNAIDSAPPRTVALRKFKTSYGIFCGLGHQSVLSPSFVGTLNNPLLYTPPNLASFKLWRK